jgi:hypothetical protein
VHSKMDFQFDLNMQYHERSVDHQEIWPGFIRFVNLCFGGRRERFMFPKSRAPSYFQDAFVSCVMNISSKSTNP